MFFNNPQQDDRQLPESLQRLRTNIQSGTQNWLSNAPAGQTVNDWQNSAQQYRQQVNDWFDQTGLGQNINQMNDVYDQRLQQVQQDEQARNTAQLAAIYDSVMSQLGL